MSCRLAEVTKLPRVEAQLGAMSQDQQIYLQVAFDELIEDPMLCNGYVSASMRAGDRNVEIVSVAIAHAIFLLALAKNKPPILVDIQMMDRLSASLNKIYV